MSRNPLAARLRLLVLTDAKLAAPRTVEEVVSAALEAGAPAIQLRDKEASPRELLSQARRLRNMTRSAGALLFVNDRVDVALAAEADGVHLGPDDLPVSEARAAVPRGFLVGSSTDDPEGARSAQAQGADYIGCGAVFRTTTKDVGGEAIGLEGLEAVARAVTIPVVAIGGVAPEGARRISTHTAAAGVAVVGAVMASSDPAAATRALLAPFQKRDRNEESPPSPEAMTGSRR